METAIFSFLILFLLGIIIFLGAFVIFLINRRSVLLDERAYYKECFNNATEEVTRLSIQLIKLKREQNKKEDIVLELDSILDKLSRIGYDNLSKEEQDYLKDNKN